MIFRSEMEFDGIKIPVYSLNTVIVGSGAAGLNCASRLFREMEETGVASPQDEIAIVTRGVGLGTSNNSGSDKQTYYKLGTHGTEPDAPVDFAKTLTAGGCAHGDVALIEGENSLRSFYHLVEAGVPFPHNARGGFVGYKTDHDPRQRATSAGPWTSRFMVQKLLAELKRYGVSFFDHHHLLAVIVDAETSESRGLLCVDMALENSENHGLVLFNCRNVVMAGGGPGDLYEISVYPKGQMGPYAALLEAGAVAHNLTESQFGLASLAPRWNLSGTYQQVVPRYFSTDANGNDEREFLNPWFDSISSLATNIFLKGYQWPFDHDKVANAGSSLIDIIVQNEMVNLGRRLFVDYRRNPQGRSEEFRLDTLKSEALKYLQRSGALQPTPIERLAWMNQPSIDLYSEMGVDLWKDPIEIGVCSQHCNGGFAVDSWWESTLKHLFVVGELAGTHGVKRPGGSALNSGQVGSLRTAERIAHIYYASDVSPDEFGKIAATTLRRFLDEIALVRKGNDSSLDVDAVKKEVQKDMSQNAGMVRSLSGVTDALRRARLQWMDIQSKGIRQSTAGFLRAMEVRELALARLAFLESIKGVLERGGGSRGSHLVTAPSGALPHQKLGDEWRFIPENLSLRTEILGVLYDRSANTFQIITTSPREMPGGEFWFENTWSEFRMGRIYQKDSKEIPKA